MCGIYGEYFLTQKLSSKHKFLERSNLNIKRGPDASGYWSDNKKVQFGFRRLSIIDTSIKGNQPMISQNGKFVMVYNGEIYNYKSLRNKLAAKGYDFNGHSDSEVLINYFECFGVNNTISVIDGMFAIALFETTTGNLYLIRDFAGIKPLYFGFKENNLVFGSRYDLITKHFLFKNEKIDNASLKTYLKMHYVPAPYGILKNTHQVEPGQLIKLDIKGRLSKKKYWELNKVQVEKPVKEKTKAIELLTRELTKSVKSQLNSDVPIGTFLSGGIDSPLISYFAKNLKTDIEGFTIGSDSIKHDETKDAKLYSEQIGLRTHIESMNSNSALKTLRKCMNSLDEPFADFSIIPTFLLSEKASIKYKVMLSGDGGDELFFGYERFNSVSKNLRFLKIPKKLRRIAYLFDKILTKNKFINECLLQENLPLSHKGLHSRTKDDILNKVFPSLNSTRTKKMLYYEYHETNNENQFLNSMRNAEFYGMMQKTLMKVDKMSMANSLEVRVPFLSRSFIETSLRIDHNLSTGQNKKKEILKNILKNLIPTAPINNVKRGFTIPLSRWIREDLKDEIFNSIFDKTFMHNYEISERNLKIVWAEHQNKIKDHKWFIFTLYSLQKWEENRKK